MWRLALILACLALAGCGVRQQIRSGARPHTHSTPAFAANERTARAFARHQLGSVRLPARSIRVTTDPAPGSLAHPQSQPGIEHLVDRHRFWRVPGSPATLLTWLRRHTPRGTSLTLSGSGGNRGVADVWTRGYSYRALPRGIYQAELDIAIAPASGGGTGVRVDSYATGLVPRPAWERVSSSVTSVRIAVFSVDGRHSYPLASVTNAARMQWLTKLFNRAQIVQPGDFISCPMIAADEPLLRFRFLAASGKELAHAAEVPCGGLKFAVGARSGPALSLQTDLTSLLWAKHILASCSAMSVKREPLTRTPAPVLFTLPFELRDTSDQACGLRGYPQVKLRLAATAAWSLPQVHRIPSGSPVTPPPVLLDRNWPASVSISWADRNCKALPFDGVQLRLPGVPTPFTMRLRRAISPCGDRISLAPI